MIICQYYIVWHCLVQNRFFFLFVSLQFIVTVSWVGNIPSLTLKGISRSLRRRGKQVREILESSILPADSGTPNAAALTKQHTVSQLAMGCVTCHTCHGCVTHFRPILGNIVEVTLMTFPIMYIFSHAKGTYFP